MHDATALGSGRKQSAYACRMDRAAAEAEAERLNAQHEQRDRFRWFARERRRCLGGDPSASTYEAAAANGHHGATAKRSASGAAVRTAASLGLLGRTTPEQDEEWSLLAAGNGALPVFLVDRQVPMFSRQRSAHTGVACQDRPFGRLRQQATVSPTASGARGLTSKRACPQCLRSGGACALTAHTEIPYRSRLTTEASAATTVSSWNPTRSCPGRIMTAIRCRGACATPRWST